MQVLNIKGPEFQNMLCFPSIFYNESYVKCDLLSPYFLVENFEQYFQYISYPFFGDRVAVSFCEIQEFTSVESLISTILENKVLMYDPTGCLMTVEDYAKTDVRQLLSLLVSGTQRVFKVGELYMFGMFGHNMRRYIEGKHHS